MGGGASIDAAQKADAQDFLPLLAQVRENGEARLSALKSLNELSLSSESKLLLANDELGLVALLVEVVKEDQNEARTRALGVLWNLTCEDRNEIPMARKELGMVSALISVVLEDKGEARIKALGALWNLTFAAENKLSMASDDLGLVTALVQVTRECRDEARIKALGALWKLTGEDANAVPMARDEIGLVATLVQVVKGDKGEARIKALGALWNLTFAEKNLAPMARDDLGLVRALVEAIKVVKGKAKEYAMGALGTLTHAQTNKIPMAREELGLLPVLMRVAREEEGQMRVYALGALANLSGEVWNCSRMARDELGLVELMVFVAQEDIGDARLYALTTLGNLTGGHGNQGPMARDQLGVVGVLMKAVQAEVGSLARVFALGALQNLTHSATNHLQMGQDSLGLVSLLTRVANEANESDGPARVEAVSALWNLCGLAENCPKIVKHGGHTAILKIFRGKALPDTDEDGLFEYGLSALMSLSRQREAATALKESGALDCIRPIFENSSNSVADANRARTALILACLTGADHSSPAGGSCLLEDAPHIFDIIVDVLGWNLFSLRRASTTAITSCGHIEMPVVTAALLALCSSDDNLAVLSRRVDSLPPILVSILRLFAENAPPITASTDGVIIGGGGEDVETAESALLTLARLTARCYASEEEMGRTFGALTTDVCPILKKLVSMKRGTGVGAGAGAGARRSLRDDVLVEAERLLSKLTLAMRSSTPSGGAAAATAGHKTYSHSSGGSSSSSSSSSSSRTVEMQAERVANDLRARGYEVWRDDLAGGSSSSSSSAALSSTASEVDGSGKNPGPVVVMYVPRSFKDDPGRQQEARQQLGDQLSGGAAVVCVSSPSPSPSQSQSQSPISSPIVGPARDPTGAR